MGTDDGWEPGQGVKTGTFPVERVGRRLRSTWPLALDMIGRELIAHEELKEKLLAGLPGPTPLTLRGESEE